MDSNVTAQRPLYLGIDGGGSKCKAIIIDAHDNVLGTGIAGPANPFQDYQQTIISIVESAYLALADAKLVKSEINRLIVGIGLAGVNLPSIFEQMSQWQHPFAQMHLTTDLHIACLGAHQGGDGAIMITGTGSCGYSHINGQATMIGAHGFLHGDKGSGAWLGLQAVKKVHRLPIRRRPDFAKVTEHCLDIDGIVEGVLDRLPIVKATVDDDAGIGRFVLGQRRHRGGDDGNGAKGGNPNETHADLRTRRCSTT